jgi:hypothetical protein
MMSNNRSFSTLSNQKVVATLEFGEVTERQPIRRSDVFVPVCLVTCASEAHNA